MRLNTILLALMTVAASLSAQAQSITLRFGYGLAEDHPQGKGVKRFTELVAKKTGGKVNINSFSASQLGSDTEVAADARAGTLDIAAVSSAPLVSVQKEFALFDLPFLFANEHQADAVVDGPIGQAILDRLADKNLVGLCYWENGFRNMTNNVRPITKLEDLKGLKVRTMQNQVYMDSFNSLGATAVPLPFPSVYLALASHTVDGEENPYTIILSNKFYEVQKYLSITRHAYSPFVILVSKQTWDKLPADQQQALHSACKEAAVYERELNRSLNDELLEKLRKNGMEVNELSDAEVQRIRVTLKPVIVRFARQIDPALINQALQKIKEVSPAK